MKQLSFFILLVLMLPMFAICQESKARTEKIRLTVGEPKSKAAITMRDLGINKVPKYHALIIGISDYKNSGPKITDLERPILDAQRLYNVLTTKYTFEKEDVLLLKDPTYQQLSKELLHLSDKIGPDENLLIFYAGHGYFDKQRGFGYWIPSDATMDDRTFWVSNTIIRDNIDAVRQAKHTLLITDACFGGSIFKGSRSAYEDALLTKFIEIYKYRSRKGITSGNLTEVPDQSVFIDQIIRKLEENEEPYITSFRLYNRIYDPVSNNSTTLPQYGVIQGVGDEGGGDFIFIRRE
jgi:hypothetical protein